MSILVTRIGAASGSRAAAAALACAGSRVDLAGLLIDLEGGRPPRASLVATGAARDLEERLAGHLPEAAVASRGQVCQLTLSADPRAFDDAAALTLVRESLGVVHLPPSLVQPALDRQLGASAALLRTDLGECRPLAALAARDLIDPQAPAGLARCTRRPARGPSLRRRSAPPAPGRAPPSGGSVISRGRTARNNG